MIEQFVYQIQTIVLEPNMYVPSRMALSQIRLGQNTNPQAEVHNFTVRCRCFNVDENNASYCLTQRPL